MSPAIQERNRICPFVYQFSKIDKKTIYHIYCIAHVQYRIAYIWIQPKRSSLYLPSQQAVEVLRGAGVWAQRGRGHIGSSLGPVLTPVVRTIGG